MYVTETLNFIISTILSLYITAILLRVILQYLRAPFHNPISQFLITITNFGIRPLRKFIPGFYGIDFAGVVLAAILAILLTVITSYLNFLRFPSLFSTLSYSFLILLGTTLNIFLGCIFLRAIFSFIMATFELVRNPIYDITFRISEPVLKPFRNILPPTAGFDLSPMAAIIAIVAIKMLFGI